MRISTSAGWTWFLHVSSRLPRAKGQSPTEARGLLELLLTVAAIHRRARFFRGWPEVALLTQLQRPQPCGGKSHPHTSETWPSVPHHWSPASTSWFVTNWSLVSGLCFPCCRFSVSSLQLQRRIRCPSTFFTGINAHPCPLCRSSRCCGFHWAAILNTETNFVSFRTYLAVIWHTRVRVSHAFSYDLPFLFLHLPLSVYLPPF